MKFKYTRRVGIAVLLTIVTLGVYQLNHGPQSTGVETLQTTEVSAPVINPTEEVTPTSLPDVASTPVTEKLAENATHIGHNEVPDSDQENTGARGLDEHNAHQLSPEEMRYRRELRRQKLRARFEGMLKDESRDAAWGAELARQAVTAVNMLPELNGSSLQATDCGTTLCRITIAAPDDKSLKVIYNLGKGVGLLTGGDAWVDVDATRYQTKIYLSRPGKELPRS